MWKNSSVEEFGSGRCVVGHISGLLLSQGWMGGLR